MNSAIDEIPLLTSRASPVDGEGFQEGLKEELRSLITVPFGLTSAL